MATVCLTCNHLNRENARFCRQCGAKVSQSCSFASLEPNGPSAEALTGRLPTNTLLAGRYLILKKIGQGGMGAVYLVHDKRLPSKRWALKEMSESSATSSVERQVIIKDFQREAELLASLNHPNIPKVIDSFNDSGRYYLAMEYVNGSTLRDLLNNRSEPFSEEEVRDWSSQLCDVLTYIHGHQPPIIFRDLKPANIMIDEGNQIKLIDFGIARLLKPGQADTRSLGTIGYAAPEQYKGQTEPRSDIYALGVTLHELLTKHDPTTVMPLKPLPSVRQLNPAISKEMEFIINRSLALELTQRWQNTHEMKATISSLLRQDAFSSRIAKQSKSKASSSRAANSSRPTTQLLLAVNKLSPKQLAMLLSGLIGLVILSVWGLAPVIRRDFPVLWDNIPTFVIAGPMAYAAIRKRWAAIVVHIPITVAFWLTLWLSTNAPLQPEPLILSAIFSGLLLEAGFYFMPEAQLLAEENWRREVAWFSGITIATVILFYLSLALLAEGYASVAYYMHPGIWLGASILGLLGWFLGDLIQQWLKIRNIIV